MPKLFLRFGVLLWLLLGLGGLQARASHLLGGEMTYRYLGALGPAANPYRYRVTVLIYVNAGSTSNVPDGRPTIPVNFYNKSQSGAFIRSVNLPRISNPMIRPPGCASSASVIQARLCRYEADVDLPVTFDGYYATYTDGTRNLGITNLRAPSDSQQQTIYMEMAPPLLPNSSPTFSDTAVVVICQGDTSLILNNAVDPDGDRLIYSFVTPYDRLANANQFTPPPVAVTYGTGYSATTPFGAGAGNYSSLNASTGLARYAVSQSGNFVVSVEVKEYRSINGREVLIGSTRREIQLVTRTCPANNTPQFTPATVAQHVYTVEEGQTMSFNIAATDPDRQNMVLKANSVLLDGSGGYNATFAGQPGTVLTGAVTGSVTVTGTSGAVNGQFSFTPRCGDARSTPYDVVITANDVANCNSKTIADVFQIFVTRTAAPTALAGDTIICSAAQARTYTASGPTPPGGYRWTVRGGTIQGSSTGSSVQVQWGSGTQGRITVRNLSAFGCQSDTVSKSITLRATIPLAVSSSATSICAGQSVTLTATGGTTYTWTGGAQPFIGGTYTVAPTQTTTYTVTTGDGTCTATRTVTVTVNPVAVASAGPDRAVCSGTPAQLGAPSAVGYTYNWSPATGLSSAAVANPTVTLTNTGTAPITHRYIVTASTGGGCVARDTVVVTVNPTATARAGADRVICSGTSTSIGDASSAVTGATYSWSPATGLSSAAVLTPTVTLTNTGTSVTTQQYILTATTAQGCVARDTVVVTVNPAAVARAGADATICSGLSTQLGATALTGYTYSWAPATGLSSATTASPTVTLSNTGNAVTTQQYILTVTTAQGCVGRDTVVVRVNPAATARAGADATICSGASTTLGAASVTGYTYSWSPATGLSSASAANPTVTLTNASTTTVLTQQYILTATNSFGCVARDTVLVRVNPTVVATAGTARAVCSGEATQLGAAALTGYTYSWSPATGLSSATVANPTFTQTLAAGSAPLTLTYTLTATSAQGCTATSTVTITLNPAALAAAGPDVDICSGKSTRLGTAALTGYSYSWAPATGLSSSSAAQPTVTGTTTTSTTVRYVLTARTAQGCLSTDTVLVRINPRPATDSIQGSASVCPTVQGVSYSIRNPRGTAYQWLVTGGTIAGGQGTAAITVNWGGATSSASVRAYRLNQFGCSSDTVTFPVRINQVLATQRPSGPQRVCISNGPFTYATQLTNGSSYGWQIIGGTQVSTNQASVVVNWTRAGIGKIVVTESSNPAGGRCLGTSDTLYVTVLPSPAAQAIAGPARLCVGNPATFSLPGGTGSSYVWTLDNGPVTGATTGSVTLPVASLPVGPHTISVIETNAQGCAGPAATRTFTVDPLPVAPTVTGPRSICPEGLNGVVYSIGTPTTGSTYQWTIVGGTLVSGQGTSSVTVNFAAAATTRSVAVAETSQFGCAGTATTLTLPFDNASVALSAASVSLTDDRKITLTLSVADRANNTNQVRITRRNAGSTGAFAPVATVANSATTYDDATVDADANAYEYRLELTNSCGTVLSTTNHTTMRLDIVGVQSGSGRTQDQITLHWTAYQGFAVQRYEVYRQADGGPLTLVQTVTPTTAPDYTVSFATGAAGFDQHYRIKAVGATQTSYSNDVNRAFTNGLEFYNVMTPNGDQLNDQFFIKNVELYPGNTITIYNRWGREVYRTTNYRNTWGGDNQPAGTYYFLFTESSGKVTKGWFEIVR